MTLLAKKGLFSSVAHDHSEHWEVVRMKNQCQRVPRWCIQWFSSWQITMGGLPLELINLMTELQRLCPRNPVWHRTGDLSHRGRGTDAQKNRVSQLGEACPSIWFYTWWNWSSKELEDASKDSPKVTELFNRRFGSRKPTCWSTGVQLHIHSSTTTSGKDHLWGQKWAQTGPHKQCAKHCPLPCLFILK